MKYKPVRDRCCQNEKCQDHSNFGKGNIIRHLELTFDAERPPPPRNVQQELLMAAEEIGEYF